MTELVVHQIVETRFCYSRKKSIVRILDSTKEHGNQSYDREATCFIQELLQLQSRFPRSVLLETLKISNKNRRISCAILPSISLSCSPKESRENIKSHYPHVKKRKESENQVVSPVEDEESKTVNNRSKLDLPLETTRIGNSRCVKNLHICSENV